MYDFLLVHHCTYSSILYHLRVFDVEYYRDLEIWLRGHSRSRKSACHGQTDRQNGYISIARQCADAR